MSSTSFFCCCPRPRIFLATWIFQRKFLRISKALTDSDVVNAVQKGPLWETCSQFQNILYAAFGQNSKSPTGTRWNTILLQRVEDNIQRCNKENLCFKRKAAVLTCLWTFVSWSKLFSKKAIFCFCAWLPPSSSESVSELVWERGISNELVNE